MSREESMSPAVERPTPEILAQAAAWIANLHDDDRGEKLEAGFRRWLAADPRHRTAFEMANEMWNDTELWPKSAVPAASPRVWSTFAPAATLAAAACVGAALLLGALLYFRGSGVATDVGEQRSLTLEDGTRVSLNTNTRIRIDYDDAVRKVRVESGEALFEVAKRPDRPFVVVAGERQITALGTAFVVRRDRQEVTVTLVEGKVQVATVGSIAETREAGSKVAVLSAGDRLTLTEAGQAKRDRPVVASAVAWQRGQVVFDRTSLADAAMEMNRYSSVKMEVEGAAAERLLVTGVFRAGDSESLAQAMAESYRLEMVSEPRRIVLKERPDTLR